jgi:hypothetical protein
MYVSKLLAQLNVMFVRNVQWQFINHVYQQIMMKNPKIGNANHVQMVSNHSMGTYVGLKWANIGKTKKKGKKNKFRFLC